MDSSYLFDMYLDNVNRYKNNQAVFSPARDNRPSPLLVDILSKERVGVATSQTAENLFRPAIAAAAAA